MKKSLSKPRKRKRNKDYDREYQQHYRETHRELTNMTARISYYKRRPEVLSKFAIKYRADREWFNALKSGSCADCQQCYPFYVMQFDHVRGKKLFCIGQKLGNKSREDLEREIAKCELVCANCHAARTYLRGQYGCNTVRHVPNSDWLKTQPA